MLLFFKAVISSHSSHVGNVEKLKLLAFIIY